ncbi:hypothetical protein ASG37_11910 [Sphingomonas sp. Leaf407]|uniref:phage holin family protein n=1 Tax=unclassified Sphingomonas TaxID=196159 RepID=UPI0006FB9E52|nr:MULTISPECIES: phage holin family protein [unclassified Sphingomonas]KQN37717.1 hypothetical protein ASE97_09200 [Sphingomonas sp. Leaf42]KQT28084.1 hypothetical protein ASG37_11910 [Sphingomonas sp. Leaf407]
MGDEGLGTVISRVVSDGKAYAQAEFTLWKSVATTRGAQAGIAAGLGVGAALVALAALTALLVGLILTLATLVGPGWATLIVVVVALLVAALMARMAMGRVRRVTAPLGDEL